MPSAEEIYTSYLSRVARGEAADLGQLCNQYPELAPALRQLHERDAKSGDAGFVQANKQADERPSTVEDLDETVGAELPDGVAPRLVGQQNSKTYEVMSEIGRGGMGVIFHVWDENLKRDLAMKMIPDQEELDESSSQPVSPRFIREAEITGRLDHPGVVPIHEIGFDEQGRAYFTMQLIRGESLSRINRYVRAGHRHWTQARVLEVIVKVCDTLAFAHSKRIIHRDLKPANIMVGQFGETYVMDWGLAKDLGDAESELIDESASPPVTDTHGSGSSRVNLSDSAAMTLVGSVIGTPAYMPPEQAKGHINLVDARSDIYSVGAMLYELLTNVKPYGDNATNTSAIEVLKSVHAGPPTPIAELNRKVPSELIAICEKAMARAQKNRYASMREMSEDLRAYLENRVVRAHKTGAIAELRKWVRRNRAVAAVSAVAILLLLAGLSTVIGIQRSSNIRIEQEKDAKALALRREQEARIREQDARKLAEQQRRSAEGLLLVSESKEVLHDHDPTLALLLAMEALARIESDEANNVLLKALDQHCELRRLTLNDARVNDANYSSDGDAIVMASADHVACIFDAKSGQPRILLVGHRSAVVTAAFDREAQRVVTASYDSTAAIWDVATGRQLHVLEHNQPVTVARFHPDGTLVATAGFDNQIHLWDTESGDHLRTLPGHTDYIRQIRFSADGKRLISGSADKTARIWNVESGELIAVLEGHRQTVSSVQFSADGRLAITAASSATNEAPIDHAARLWHADTGELIAQLSAGTPTTSAAFSNNGQWVAIGCADGTVRLWDIRSKSFTQVFAVDECWITGVRFSEDGRFLLAVTSTNTVVTWEVETGHRLATLWGHDETIRSARFSPDATHILTSSEDGTARVWQADHRRIMPQFRHGGAVNFAHLAADRMVTLVGEKRVPHLWAIDQGTLLATLPHAEAVASAAFSPDATLLITTTTDGQAYVWSARDGQLLRTLPDCGSAANIAFTSDGHTVLLYSNRDKMASTWDIDTAERKRDFDVSGTWLILPDPTGHHLLSIGDEAQLLDVNTGQTTLAFVPPAYASPQFSPNGEFLRVFPGNGTQISLWRVTTGSQLATLGLEGMISFASFSNDGKWLLAASRDGSAVRKFDVTTGKQIDTFAAAATQFVVTSPNGERLLTKTADGTARLWHLQTGKPIALLRSKTRFNVFQFSRDSRFVVGGAPFTTGDLAADDEEKSVALWDAESGRPLWDVQQNSLLLGDAFTPDRKWIVTLDQEGTTVRFWPLDPPRLARRYLTRHLTAEERDLSQGGTTWVRDAVHREAALDSIYAALELVTQLDHFDSAVQSFLYKTFDKLLSELGPEASLSELRSAKDRVEALLPDTDPFVLSRLADLALRAGDVTDAVELLERAVQLPTSTWEVESKLTELRRKFHLPSFGTIDANEVRSDDAVAGPTAASLRGDSTEGEHLRVRYSHALRLQRAGRYKAAIDLYQEILAKDDEQPEPYVRLAECLLAQHNALEAAKVLRDALQHPTCRTRAVWNQWMATELAGCGVSPREMLANFPHPDALEYAGDFQWLLQQLVDRQTIRINCGGDEFVDDEGNTWSADRLYTHGFRYFRGQSRFTDDIANTDADELYQTERYFDPRRTVVPAAYQIPLPAGQYRIKLHFAEIYLAGVRSFNVAVEDRMVLEDYDPSARGFAVADIQVVAAEVQDGLLNIEFHANREAAKISAIEIEMLDGKVDEPSSANQNMADE